MGRWGERAGLEADHTKRRPQPPHPTPTSQLLAGAGPFKGPALRRAHVSGLRKPARSLYSNSLRAKEVICPAPLTLVETEAQERAQGQQQGLRWRQVW